MAADKDIDTGDAPTGTHVLKVKKGDTTYSIKLYDTEAETGTPGAIYGTMKLRIDGATYYARITQHLGGDAAGGATPLRYKSSSGAIYQVTQKGEFSITVPSSDNQTICVSANGQTYKGANTLWFAEGTEWKAYVEADSDHIAGSLNLTSGTLNSTVKLSVTPATEIPSGSQSYSYNGQNDNVGQFTVPTGITVLHVEGTTPSGADNNMYNIKVTPGKTYPITGRYKRWKSGSRYYHSHRIYFNGLEVSYKQGSSGVTMSISWSSAFNGYGADHDFS